VRHFKTAVLAGSLVTAFVLGCASGPPYGSHQPHMQGALVALQNALAELQQAEANKGGHRERAIGLTEQAIAEVERGIQFAAEHGN
jgi:hypothetical protein